MCCHLFRMKSVKFRNRLVWGLAGGVKAPRRASQAVGRIPKFHPYGPFVGATSPILERAQFADCTGSRPPGCGAVNSKPVGTGDSADKYRRVS